MANVNNTLQATIITTDPNNATPINRNINNPAFAAAMYGDFITNIQIPNADAELLILPNAPPAYNIYVKNLAAPGGANITIKGTPQGGVAATLCILPPGGVFIYWGTTSGAALGFSSVKLNASVAATPAEYFIGG